MAIDRAHTNLDCTRPGLILLLLLCCAEAAEVAPATLEAVNPPAQLFQAEKGTERLAQLGIERIVFVTRLTYDDPHWYANIGYYCDDENHKAYAGNGKPDESCLYELNTKTGQISVLLDGNGGGVRDPKVHYDGRTILFSYRQPATDDYS